MSPFLAVIAPVNGPYPDQGLPGRPPGRPDQGLPVYPDNSLPRPPGYISHPIVLPGVPTHPIVIVPPNPGGGDNAPGIPVNLPVYPWTPTHPIVIPPPAVPDQGLPPFPSHPIVLPPTMPDGDNRPVEWKVAWFPETGWIVVGIPKVPVPTPS